MQRSETPLIDNDIIRNHLGLSFPAQPSLGWHLQDFSRAPFPLEHHAVALSNKAGGRTSADADLPFDLNNMAWHGMVLAWIGVDPTGFLEAPTNAVVGDPFDG